MGRSLQERLGPVLAWSPAILVVVAMLPALGSYLTTGHRFKEPFHVALHAVADRIQPEDAVFVGRYEIGQYELEREDIFPLPGRLNAMDRRAAGQTAWVVRLSGNARGPIPWKPGKDPRMQLVFSEAAAVWMPRREISAYRLSPPAEPPTNAEDQP